MLPATQETSAPPLEMNIEAAKAHFAKFNQLKRALLTVNIHYGKIPGIEKPFLFQPGAQVLAKTFNITVSFEETTRTLDLASGFVSYEYRATCFHNGLAIGQGVGSCNTFEDKYCFSAWQDAPEPDAPTKRELISQGLGKTKPGWQGSAPRWQQRHRKSPTELIAVQNTVQKMAGKRAYVCCVLNSTGGAEFFGQDIELPGDVIDAASQLDQAKAAILHTIKQTLLSEKELKQMWAMLPSMRHEAWLLEALKARNSEVNPATK